MEASLLAEEVMAQIQEGQAKGEKILSAEGNRKEAVTHIPFGF